MKRVFASIGMIACALLAENVFAKEAATSDFVYHGYLDTSYNYLVQNHQFISGANDRVNDLAQNGFTLHQAAFTVAKQPAYGLGGLFNMVVGRDANNLAPYGWNPYYGSQTLAMFVPNAYLQYGLGTWIIMGGMFESEVGYENFDPNANNEFSRGILNGYAEPGVFMGLRAHYFVNDHITLNGGINNGWSGLRDTGRGKTLEGGIRYTYNPMWSFIAQAVTGEQRLVTNTPSGPTGRRNMINMIGLLTLNDQWSFVLAGDYGMQTKALASSGEIKGVTWQGLAAYAVYHFMENWRATVRTEWYDDGEGYTTGVRQNWREATLALCYDWRKDVEMRLETRHDISNKHAFMDVTGPGTSQHQQSLGFEVIYHI